MKDRVTLPFSGELLLAHLAAYGLLVVLEASRTDATFRHSHESLTYEPEIEFRGGTSVAANAIQASAAETEAAIEADLESGKRGNDRRPVIWARASFANDPSRAKLVLAARQSYVTLAETDDQAVAQGLLGGLGAPAAWGGDRLKPSAGATVLDGVLGNHTSDFVRGVLRPARLAAAEADASHLDAAWHHGRVGDQEDKTGWAPPGTRVDLVHQWLAALGLSLLPVAHSEFKRSTTPACWAVGPGRRGVTLPIFDRAVTVARLRSILALEALPLLADGEGDNPQFDSAAAELRGLEVNEAVSFERQTKPGSGTSVAFSFTRGHRIGLR